MNMTSTKRLTPAGQGAAETEWTTPDLAHRESWLSEARGIYHANKDRRAADGWVKAMHAARQIQLIAAVDEREALLDERRQQIADALREREALEARCAVLQRQTDELQSKLGTIRRALRVMNRDVAPALPE